MKTAVDQGGFVYPFVFRDEEEHRTRYAEYGITRRDWLAGMAMQALVSIVVSTEDNMHPHTALEIGKSAYHIADIMIRMSKEELTGYDG